MRALDRHVALILMGLHWALLLVAAPFLLFPTPDHSPALLLVPFSLLLAWAASRRALPVTAMNVPILLLATMLLVSLWATFDLSHSLPKIAGLLWGLAVFFAFARAAQSHTGWGWSLAGFLAAGCAVAAVSLLGTAWVSKFTLLAPFLARFPQVFTGLAGAESGIHPNEVAGALLWVLPVFLVILSAMLLRPSGWFSRRRLWHAFSVVALALGGLFCLVAFLLSQSRGGYLSFLLAALLAFWAALPRRWRWISLVVLVLVAAAGGVYIQQQGGLNQLWMRLASQADNSASWSLSTLAGRLDIWARAIYAIGDFPLTGMGMNNFRRVVHLLYPLAENPPDRDFGHAHNEFLQTGLDLGIPGLIALASTYISGFWMLLRMWKRAGQMPHADIFVGERLDEGRRFIERSLALALGTGLLAHFFYGMTDAVALGAKPGFLFWMLLGLIAGLYNRQQEGAGG